MFHLIAIYDRQNYSTKNDTHHFFLWFWNWQNKKTEFMRQQNEKK